MGAESSVCLLWRNFFAISKVPQGQICLALYHHFLQRYFTSWRLPRHHTFETGVFWFAGWLEEMTAAPFLVPSGAEMWVKPTIDLFQGGGRAVLCCLQMVLLPLAPCL